MGFCKDVWDAVAHALKSVLVDAEGSPISEENPLPVSGTVPEQEPDPVKKVGTDPAAGFSSTLVVPTGKVWEIRTAQCGLVSGAAPAARYVYFRILDAVPAVVSYVGFSPRSQANATTYTYFWNPGSDGHYVEASPILYVNISGPTKLTLPAGWTLEVAAFGMGVNDNFGPITAQVIERDA